MSDSTEQKVILYHGDCPDGFSAAWAAWKKLGESALYFPMQYRTAPPEEIKGREVYTLDFPYPKEAMEQQLLPVAKKVTIIDHHVGSKDLLSIVHESLYDEKHSGAVLSWHYFHPGVPVPKLLLYVEDMDLWLFKMPFAKEIGQVISSKQFGFKEWSMLAEQFEDPAIFEKLVEQGKILGEKTDKIVQKIVDNAEEVLFEGHQCLMANSPFFVSEVGAALVKKLPPMGIVWSRRKNRVVVSLRGDGTIDLNEIAKKYGGGGHPNAAAFSWDEEKFVHFQKGVV